MDNYPVLNTTLRSSPLSSRSLTKLAGGLKGSGGSSPATTVHDISTWMRGWCDSNS
uniref:Uncharacterized protein n=1 Tax=Setaria italica TaxID=4555 RepID=K3Z144_SETIT